MFAVTRFFPVNIVHLINLISIILNLITSLFEGYAASDDAVLQNPQELSTKAILNFSASLWDKLKPPERERDKP